MGKHGTNYDEMYIPSLRERLAEIDDKIAATKQWGALLTALNEERRAILKNLGQTDTPDMRAGD